MRPKGLAAGRLSEISACSFSESCRPKLPNSTKNGGARLGLGSCVANLDAAPRDGGRRCAVDNGPQPAIETSGIEMAQVSRSAAVARIASISRSTCAPVQAGKGISRAVPAQLRQERSASSRRLGEPLSLLLSTRFHLF